MVRNEGTARWGIAATGHIASRFTAGLRELGSDVVAVGSRDQGRADAFGERFGIPHRHGSYEALAADPDVDVVYVASPHTGHAPHTLLFLEAGKHVLCEKPFALHQGQGRAMVDAARSRGLFLMDAVWSRFLPGYVRLRELLAEGRIGRPVMVDAELGFRVPFDPTSRLYDRSVGGGALLDLGIYPVQLVSMVLGPPDAVTGTGSVGPTGVDEVVAGTLHHPGGAVGVIRATLTGPLACSARVVGTEGWIELGRPMHAPPELTVGVPTGREDRVVDRIDTTHTGEGLRFEAVEVERCLAAGLTESPTMPLDETLSIMGTLDALRATTGVTYPGE